jgi:hypothetical protein
VQQLDSALTRWHGNYKVRGSWTVQQSDSLALKKFQQSDCAKVLASVVAVAITVDSAASKQCTSQTVWPLGSATVSMAVRHCGSWHVPGCYTIQGLASLTVWDI